MNEKSDKKNLKCFTDMAVACTPISNGGKYPMWIQIPYIIEEHKIAHAHLFASGQKPTELITKFVITDNPPTKIDDIIIMPNMAPIPKKYADLLIDWAKDFKNGINNWILLKTYWSDFEETVNMINS